MPCPSKQYPHRQRDTSQDINRVQYLENIFAQRGNLITMIRFYAGHECLWNEQHAEYHNLRKRSLLWSWIAKQFGPGVTGSEVECVMNGLRGQALDELRRIQECKRRGGVCDKPSFDLLEEFRFLLPEEVNVESQAPVAASAYAMQPSLTEPQPAFIALGESERLQHSDEVSNPVSIPTFIAANCGCSEGADADLDEFCSELRQELSQLPPDACLKAQKKILLPCTRSE